MLNLLKSYVDLIQDEEIRTDVYRFLGMPEVQQSFKGVSSSSGMFHPEDENNDYGLLIHSMRVCNVALQMYRSYIDRVNDPLNFDIIVAGSLLHDVPYKVNENGHSNRNHAHDNAKFFMENTKLSGDKALNIMKTIMWHMGRWNPSTNSDYEKYPMDVVSWIVHLSDCIVSRRNIKVDINSVGYLKSNL